MIYNLLAFIIFEGVAIWNVVALIVERPCLKKVIAGSLVAVLCLAIMLGHAGFVPSKKFFRK